MIINETDFRLSIINDESRIVTEGQKLDPEYKIQVTKIIGDKAVPAEGLL